MADEPANHEYLLRRIDTKLEQLDLSLDAAMSDATRRLSSLEQKVNRIDIRLDGINKLLAQIGHTLAMNPNIFPSNRS